MSPLRPLLPLAPSALDCTTFEYCCAGAQTDPVTIIASPSSYAADCALHRLLRGETRTCPDGFCVDTQTNPVTIIGLLDTIVVPKGEWLLHSAAGSVRPPYVQPLECYCRNLVLCSAMLPRRAQRRLAAALRRRQRAFSHRKVLVHVDASVPN